MARHRRPVNVRDDGLPAVLGPLVNEGGVERALLLDVDSGMVLDAWARGEGVAPDDPAAGSGAASGTVGDTVPGGGAALGPGAAFRGGASLDGTLDTGGGAGLGDVEALGARHADLVRALFALAGTPPAELSLVVDDRHHLVRCVADPAGGRLALAVVVAGSSWVVRRVRRHLRQLPDAGLTTGPWILSWAMGPPPAPKPPADRPQASGRAGLSAADRPTGEASATVHDGWLPSSSAQPQSGGADGWPAVEGLPPAPNDDTPTADPTTAVPDPRRGPAPPSALPPARSAGR